MHRSACKRAPAIHPDPRNGHCNLETRNRPLSRKPASRLRRVLDFCLRLPNPTGSPVNMPDEQLSQDDSLELDRLGQRFSNEIFAQLLLELPTHRSTMELAFKTGDYRLLRDSIHQLLGAAAYCEAPELDSGLRELRLALQTGDCDSIDPCFTRVINIIDSILRDSGYRGSD